MLVREEIWLFTNLSIPARLSLRYPMAGNVWATIVHGLWSQRCVLGHTTLHALSPHPERGCFHLRTHQRHDRRLVQAELQLNGFKRCAVFPGHLHNTRNICV